MLFIRSISREMSLGRYVPAKLILSIGSIFAVGLVASLVVADEIVKGKTIMAVDVVDTLEWTQGIQAIIRE